MLAAIQGAKKVPPESAVHVLKGLRVFLDVQQPWCPSHQLAARPLAECQLWRACVSESRKNANWRRR